MLWGNCTGICALRKPRARDLLQGPRHSLRVPHVYTMVDTFGTQKVNIRSRAAHVEHGPAERALLVGIPEDVDHATGMVNVLPFGGGTPRFWAPGSGGVPSAGSSRFGAALADGRRGGSIDRITSIA